MAEGLSHWCRFRICSSWWGQNALLCLSDYPRSSGVGAWHLEGVGPWKSCSSALLCQPGVSFKFMLSCTSLQVFHPLLLELTYLPGSCRGGLYLGAPSLITVCVGTPSISFYLMESPSCFYLEIYLHNITWQGGSVASFMQVDVLPGC